MGLQEGYYAVCCTSSLHSVGAVICVSFLHSALWTSFNSALIFKFFRYMVSIFTEMNIKFIVIEKARALSANPLCQSASTLCKINYSSTDAIQPADRRSALRLTLTSLWRCACAVKVSPNGLQKRRLCVYLYIFIYIPKFSPSLSLPLVCINITAARAPQFLTNF